MLFLLSLVACAEEELACTTIAVSSVMATPTLNGVPYPASLTATDANGNDVPVMCTDGASDSSTCTEYAVGWEVAGEITLDASSYDGCNYGTGSVTVTVEMDDVGCHVETVVTDVPLEEWTDLDCG